MRQKFTQYDEYLQNPYKLLSPNDERKYVPFNFRSWVKMSINTTFIKHRTESQPELRRKPTVHWLVEKYKIKLFHFE